MTDATSGEFEHPYLRARQLLEDALHEVDGGGDVTGENGPPVYDPHPGLECCPCVPRLRQQNHEAAAQRDKQHREDQSDLDGLRSLMREAMDTHRKGNIGISAYGQAALAAAFQVADEAEGKAEAFHTQMLRERRGRLAVERDLRVAREAFRAADSGSSPTPGEPG